MNSCLYKCDVLHHRLEPKENKFDYSVFMFYLDLDELDLLHKKMPLFSRNRFNWFSFYDKDHLVVSTEKNINPIKIKVVNYLKAQGVKEIIGRVMLLTNASVLGYGFNPISVYICFDLNEQPLCAVAEVCNTHSEMKLYLLDKSHFSEDTFDLIVPKFFYVSPFVSMDASFRFIFKIPTGSLHFRVDDYEKGRRFLLTSLQGESTALTDSTLLKFAFLFPLIPLRIFGLIHWQAFILWLKKIPYKQKKTDLDLQQNMFHYK